MKTKEIQLPEPNEDARAVSAALCRLLVEEIQSAGGWLPFSRYMSLALYAPGLGYYSGGSQKFGAAGDFVTAPEISPLFGQTLARPAAAVMAQSAPYMLEAGAGSGALAAELLGELERLGALPQTYFILELSGELRERQRQTLMARVPHLLPRVVWLDAMPSCFSGLVLGNELLDAMPVSLVVWDESGDILERGVSLDAQSFFSWSDRPAQGALRAAAQRLDLAPPYVSEINLAAEAWVASWSCILDVGALLLIDYGFPRHEYYHAQRRAGTLMCHYRHHAHDNPFWWPGLNDITAHVDFTAIAEAGFQSGLSVEGYTTQANFLLNCGLTDALSRLQESGSGPGGLPYLAAARAAEKLILPHEMGELFKVIALGRNLGQAIPGFMPGDRLHTL